MTQYCRYCKHVNQNYGIYKCQKTGKIMYGCQMKHTNNCKEFEFNPVDVLRENVKGYKPTGKKIVQYGGLGEQIRMEEIINV